MGHRAIARHIKFCFVKVCENYFKFISRVVEVKGTHMELHSNDDVKSIYGNNQNCKFIPKSIETFFPNVLTFWIFNSGIRSIEGSDLAPFRFLKRTNFSGNLIQNLPIDLFVYNEIL